jgi:predicted ATP-dependent Lon-type protease
MLNETDNGLIWVYRTMSDIIKSGFISIESKDFLMYAQDVQGIGMTDSLSLAAFIELFSEFRISFYKRPEELVFKALGFE